MNRFVIPVLVFIVAGSIGVFTSWSAYTSATEAQEARFSTVADDFSQSLLRRLGQHISLLQATRAFFSAIGGPANGKAFEAFVDKLDIDGTYDGVQGIGFALRINAGEEAAAEQIITRNYDLEREIWPESGQDERAPTILLSPLDFRNNAAVGFDMYSDQARRAAMRAALSTGTARATAPVELEQEVTSAKQAGFLIFLPYFENVTTQDSGTEQFVSGYVFAPFRVDDLFAAVLEDSWRLPVVVQAFDITGGDSQPVYSSANADTLIPQSEFMVTLVADVAGRQWQMNIYSTSGFKRTGARDLALVLGIISVLLASALGVSANAQLNSARSAKLLQAVTDRNLQEKDLMLQEMKHRIKNSIARMLAIARQTVTHSSDLEEFTETYSSRLQAMATAQDMLTRSHWQRAKIKELLVRELEQVNDSSTSDTNISGPDVELDEKAVQSLGLTFHELATNALKYGDGANGTSKLKVDWAVTGHGTDARLHITWQELGNEVKAPEAGPGFGTRLIDTSVQTELSGTIERHYEDTGFRVEIAIPAIHFSTASSAPPTGRKLKTAHKSR